MFMSEFEPRLNQSPVLRYDGEHQGSAGQFGPPQSDPANRKAGSADMDVNGPSSVQGAFPVKAVQPPIEVAKTSEAKPAAPRDELDISAAGKTLEDLSRSPEVRTERLAQIKAAIDAGTYDTDEKLNAALEKLLGEIGSDNDND